MKVKLSASISITFLDDRSGCLVALWPYSDGTTASVYIRQRPTTHSARHHKHHNIPSYLFNTHPPPTQLFSLSNVWLQTGSNLFNLTDLHLVPGDLLAAATTLLMVSSLVLRLCE